jgi:hypothetical protein
MFSDDRGCEIEKKGDINETNKKKQSHRFKVMRHVPNQMSQLTGSVLFF